MSASCRLSFLLSSLLSLLLSFSVLLTSTHAYARKTKEQKSAERDAYWGVFADVYRADLALARTPPNGQLAVEALNTAISHVAAVDQTVAESFKTLKLTLQEAKHLVERGRMNQASQQLTAVRKLLINDYAPHVAPVVAPKAVEGEKLYKEYCSSCHGDGLGQSGSLSSQLKIVPQPFNSPGFAGIQSPFGTYAVSIHGVDQSEMVSLLEIIDVDQLWSIAFYVSSIPHKVEVEMASKPIDERFMQWFDQHRSEFSLSTLAVSSDEELLNRLQRLGFQCRPCDREIAFLRNHWALGGQAGRIGDLTKSPREKAESRALILLLVSVIAVSGAFIFVLRSSGRVE